MSRKLDNSPAVIGIDIGKNSFHIVGLHIFDPLEAGQICGLSRLTPAIVTLWMLDLYDAAARIKRGQQIRVGRGR